MPSGSSNHRLHLTSLFALLAAPASAQQASIPASQAPPPASLVQARKALGLLVDASNFARYGFGDPSEVATAVPGTPIRRFVIRPDRIRAYRQGVDPASLLEETGDWIYPLTVGGSVRCGMTLSAGRPGEWKLVSAGQPGFARRLFEARTAEALLPPQPDESRFFLLEVLSTRARLLVYRTDGKLPTERPGSGRFQCVWIGRPIGDRPLRQPAEPIFAFLSQVAQEAKAKAPRP